MAISNLSWLPLSYHANTPENIAAAMGNPRAATVTMKTGDVLQGVKIEKVVCEFSGSMLKAGVKIRCPKSGVLDLDMSNIEIIR